ncbi:MAG: hypothetical protein ACK5F5_02700 [Gammaproteobacteria bacterium]|jgi:hypothetical protein
MTVEPTRLVDVCVFTVLMRVPYIFDLIAVRGLTQAVGYPTDPKPIAPWAHVAHAAACAFAIPWLCTPAFAVGVGAMLCIAAQRL